uniref:Uncharacterized protein n=1 Tax=Pipistrellus kuhlii TaxID=59472 RepID=A0A7J7WDD2_PIPKU|nr:hypothetical protein mPipKuh1_008072 [Pipistrellus kuhlii]
MPLNEFSNLIPHQSLQGCSDRLSNSANPSRLFMHANYSTCSVPKATLCSSKKPAQIGQSQRGGLLKKRTGVVSEAGGSLIQNIGLNLCFNCKIRGSFYTLENTVPLWPQLCSSRVPQPGLHPLAIQDCSGDRGELVLAQFFRPS